MFYTSILNMKLHSFLPLVHLSERLYDFIDSGSAGSMPKGGVRVMQPEGRDQRWVCVSQLMRVSTDRLHHQHPTLTAVEGSVSKITEPRQHRRIIPRSAGAGVTLLSSDNIVC